MFYRVLLKPLLFLLSAETAHRLVLASLAFIARFPFALSLLRALYGGRPDPSLRVRALGREFPSPLGLAAGLDKDAEAIDAFLALGFGFVEVGTLTAEAQPGNPRPRLFRLPRDRALVNRMGFNNRGAVDAVVRLSRPRPPDAIVGVNIGKQKRVPNEHAAEDYERCAELVAAHADYVVVNVSSPNTAGLRELQAIEPLRALLVRVRAALDRASPSRRVPLLVKIAPDLSDQDVDAVAVLAHALALDGIIAVNTTVSRAGLASSARKVRSAGDGGLSGVPLRARSLEVLARLRERVGPDLALISAGGIADAEDVWARLEAGANLVQLYTALIYAGPTLARVINGALSRRLAAKGLGSCAALSAQAAEQAASETQPLQSRR